MHGEKLYQLHEAQRQLLRPLNNLEKTDPSKIERTYNIKNSRLGFIESVHEYRWKVQQFSCPLAPS